MLSVFQSPEIVERVKYPSLVGGYFRPPIKNLNIPDYVRQCLMLCWEEEPEERYTLLVNRFLKK